MADVSLPRQPCVLTSYQFLGTRPFKCATYRLLLTNYGTRLQLPTTPRDATEPGV
jgi:hypothetical protein